MLALANIAFASIVWLFGAKQKGFPKNHPLGILLDRKQPFAKLFGQEGLVPSFPAFGHRAGHCPDNVLCGEADIH